MATIDVFGKLLTGFFNGDLTSCTIRRDDGWFDEHETKVYFSKYEEWENYEREVLNYVQGRVLDLGAGAGRHALYLQGKGFEVHAIDISTGAVEVMKKRGVENVYLMDLQKLDFPDNYFDSTLMMFNNFGLVGTIEGTKNLLKGLHRISTSKGKIITTIRNPYLTDNLKHLAYHEQNRKKGKPAGQVKIRIEYKGEAGSWFELLMVSPDELKDLIRDTGWKILKIIEGEDGCYGAILEKIKN